MAFPSSSSFALPTGKRHLSDVRTCRHYLFFLGLFDKLLCGQTTYAAKLDYTGIVVTFPLPFLFEVWKEFSGRVVKTGHRSIMHNFPVASEEDPIFKGMSSLTKQDAITLTIKLAREIIDSEEANIVKKSVDCRSIAYFAWMLFSTVRPFNEEDVRAIRDTSSKTRVFINVNACIDAVVRLARCWKFSPRFIIAKYVEKASFPYRKNIRTDGFPTTSETLYSAVKRIEQLMFLPDFPALKNVHSLVEDVHPFVEDVQPALDDDDHDDVPTLKTAFDFPREQLPSKDLSSPIGKCVHPIQVYSSTEEEITPPIQTQPVSVQVQSERTCIDYPNFDSSSQRARRYDLDSETDDEVEDD